MSSKVYGSEDNENFELNLTPGNKCLLANVPGITPDKLNKQNLEQLLGNYTPVITVSSSSTSELRSSKFINPFNDTNSSEPRNSRIMNNDGLQSSNSSNLQYLLPPISFTENSRSKNDKEEVGLFHRNSQCFAREMKYVLQPPKHLPHNEDNLLVSSPITQNHDVVIDKDLLTSEADNYNDHLYPWIPKQESEGCDSYVESTLISQTDETSSKKYSYIGEDSYKREPNMQSPVTDKKLEYDKHTININNNKRLTKERRRNVHNKKTLPLMILIKPKNLRKEINKMLKKSDKEVYDTTLYSGDMGDQDYDEHPAIEDEEYLPAYKITRSKSRRNRIDLNSYSNTNVHDKKKKIGPRSKSGCWTCRVRHKACPEERPMCSQCLRLNLDCDYSSIRPKYMIDPVLQSNKLKEIRNITFKQKRNNFIKGGIQN